MKVRAPLAGVLLGMAVLGSVISDQPRLISTDLNDYLENPGRQQATEVGAQCGSGSRLGEPLVTTAKQEPLRPGEPNGTQTGLNNSALLLAIDKAKLAVSNSIHKAESSSICPPDTKVSPENPVDKPGDARTAQGRKPAPFFRFPVPVQ